MLICRKPQRQGVSDWKRHVHINGTIYYSLDRQGEEWLFLRIVTREDVTDPDIQEAIEDCGREYHQWLEEADLEDLPDDLELLVYFDNPYHREPIGSFVSYQKQVELGGCQREPGDSDSESQSGSATTESTCDAAYLYPLRDIAGPHPHHIALGLTVHPWLSEYGRRSASGSHRSRILCTIPVATPTWKLPSSPLWPIVLTVRRGAIL
jgi:hypothetical protein